jgi:hypothetical protein
MKASRIREGLTDHSLPLVNLAVTVRFLVHTTHPGQRSIDFLRPPARQALPRATKYSLGMNRSRPRCPACLPASRRAHPRRFGSIK